MTNTVLVVFSYDRPLQLELCLRSFNSFCEDNINIKKFVLCKFSNDKYEGAYIELSKQYPEITFVKENIFKNDLLQIISDKEYVLFSVDDTVYMNNFSISKMIDVLKSIPRTIGFSLRLGKNINYCYTKDAKMNVPPIAMIYDNIGFYNWTGCELDWGYPLEVSSSLFAIRNIGNILYYSPYNNPNELEWNMYRTSEYMKELNNLFCYNTSRAFSIPINKVQNTNDNRVGNNNEYSVQNLLTKFNNGDRIDLTKFNGFIPKGCHQEVELW